MKFNLRWQILLAILGFTLVAAILSFQVQSSSLCTTRVPAAGGVFAEGVVGLPQYLNPLLSDANPVDRQLSSLIFDGLTTYDPETGQLTPVLAQNWSVSEDGRSVRFNLRQDVLWQDGEPFTANDVAFTYGLMQDESFPGAPALANLWQTVTINVIDEYTIEFVLSEPYAPFMDATTRGILPAHRFADSPFNLTDHPFNQAPIGTGPWMVNEGQNWQENGRLQLSPNPMIWREGTQIPTLEFQFFADDAATVAALQDGRIQAISHVSAEMLPEVASIAGIRLFTAETPRYTELLFNMQDTAVSLLQSVEGRQALAYGLHRQELINNVLNGQGLLFEGPYLPNNWAYNPTELTQYTQDIANANALLDSQGWLLVEGQAVRQNEGTPLNLRLLTINSEPYISLANGIAGQWQQIGVQTELIQADSGAQLREWLDNGEFDVALVDVTPNGDPDLYDFWSQEAIIAGQNYGGWNNRRASEALESGRQLWPVAERRPSYDSFIRIFNNNLPALSLYQHAATYALSDTVNEAQIGKITHPRDRYQTFANWFLLYRDVSVACPVEELN